MIENSITVLAGFDPDTMASTGASTAKHWFMLGSMVVSVVLIIFGAWKMLSAIFSAQKRGANLGLGVVALVAGFLFGLPSVYSWFQGTSQGFGKSAGIQ